MGYGIAQNGSDSVTSVDLGGKVIILSHLLHVEPKYVRAFCKGAELEAAFEVGYGDLKGVAGG